MSRLIILLLTLIGLTVGWHAHAQDSKPLPGQDDSLSDDEVLESLEPMPLSDPTEPAGFSAVRREDGTSERKPGVLALEEVLVSSERKIAVINGQTVIEGDWVGNAVVIEIQPLGVLLRRNGNSMMLTLENEEVKTLIEGDNGE